MFIGIITQIVGHFLLRNLTVRYGNAPMAQPNVLQITSVPWARPVPAKYCQDSMLRGSAKAARIEHGPIKKERETPSGKYRVIVKPETGLK